MELDQVSSHPTTLELHAAWVLVATFVLSAAYELWRATAKAGSSVHDSMRVFLTQDLVLYALGTVVIVLLFAGVGGAAWIGLVFCAALILLSIFYYNPKIMLERDPGLIDLFEDLTYTGLLFVAGALLLHQVLRWALVAV